MPNLIHAFDYIDAKKQMSLMPVSVFFGDEPFLKRLAIAQARHAVDEDEVPVATFEGKNAEWRDVFDEVSTFSLFSGDQPRRVLIDDADDFVSKNRSQLEDFVTKPRRSGVLLLNVQKWSSNTRLYKLVAKHGLAIECRAPEKPRGKSKLLDEDRLCKWLANWSRKQHDAKLDADAAQLMLETIGPELGLLDQEIAKLALFAGPGGTITQQLVADVVGGWRTKTTWELLDAAADGDTAEALRQLDRLLQSGEHPNALFGQLSWSMRRYAAATRIYQQAESDGRRVKLGDALEQAGFRRWPTGALQQAEQQLKQLGRERAGQFHQWLLTLDLALKGSHSTPERARFALEHLFLRMAKQTK